MHIPNRNPAGRSLSHLRQTNRAILACCTQFELRVMDVSHPPAQKIVTLFAILRAQLECFVQLLPVVSQPIQPGGKAMGDSLKVFHHLSLWRHCFHIDNRQATFMYIAKVLEEIEPKSRQPVLMSD